jgi:hypothetical protein
MHFHELAVFGVYISPLAPLLLASWLVVVALRRLADRFGVLDRVWHPALFEFGLYVIVLACAVLIQAGWS